MTKTKTKKKNRKKKKKKTRNHCNSCLVYSPLDDLPINKIIAPFW
jgi:hypothetical protein